MKFIKKFDNFLSEELYDESIKTARHLIDSSSMCFATHRCWNADIVKDSFPVLIHSISPESDFYGRLHEEFYKNLGPFFSKQKITTQMNPEFLFYYWTRFSYIPWHSDANFHGGLTVYLNEQWNRDWGGYFMHKNDDDTITAIPPERNAAILQFGGVMHSTTTVNYDGELRITLQVFFNKE